MCNLMTKRAAKLFVRRPSINALYINYQIRLGFNNKNKTASRLFIVLQSSIKNIFFTDNNHL